MMNSMNPCCCCLLRLPEKDLRTPYIRQGATEIFADMLEECFQIQLAVNEKDWGICKECVGRLRDASNFKQQVQRSQEKLWARLELQHVKIETELDSKIPHDDVVDNEETVIQEPECESKTSHGVVFNEDISIEIMPIPDVKSEAAPVSSAQPGSSTELVTSNTGNKLYDTVHQCNICLATFILESNLALHMKNMHDNFTNQPNIVFDTFEKQFTMFCSSGQEIKRGRGRGPYTCRDCAAVFQNRSLYNDHKREKHKMKKVHSCHICGKVFKRKYLCTEHVRTHTGEKPFVCGICNKSFTSNRWLTTHMRLHNGQVFICDVCNKQYTKKYVLILHMRVHSGDKPYECGICKMQFVNSANLEQHKAVHSEKSYSCDVCEERFRRKEHLKFHSLVHSKQKPYSCEICDLKFTAKSHVKRHKRKVHSQIV